VSLSTTAINDRHALHRSGHLPGIHQKWSVASRFAWSMDYHVCGAMLEACHIQNPSQSPNSKKRCSDLGKPVPETDQQGCWKFHTLTEDMHQSWRWTIGAHKVTVKHEIKCSRCCFSDAVLLCSTQTFFIVRKSLSVHAKISVTLSYLKIIKRHLAFQCT